MRLQEWLERVVLGAARRPRLTLGMIVLLALCGTLLSLGLQPSTGPDTFVGRSSPEYQATTADARQFGSDPVVILVREPLTDLLETKDLAVITQLEACLAGQAVVANTSLSSFTPAPAGTAAYGGARSPCGQLMRSHPAKVVYGPGTFLNRAVAAVNGQVAALLAQSRSMITTRERQAYQLALGEHLSVAQARQAAQAAGTVATQQAETQMEQLYLDSGIKGMPRIDDPTFIQQIVFDDTRGVNQPKARFAYLFPNAGSALIQVRLRAGLTAQQQTRAIQLIRAAVRMPRFRLGFGGTYTVSGVPVVTDDLAATVTGSIAELLIGAVAVMAFTLLVVFRRRLRLLPLAVALVASGITFGLTALLGASLTMASVAVLPILIGLAVDYAVQFQSRAGEVDGRAPQEAPRRPPLAGARPPLEHLGLRSLAVAALATAAGFLVLLSSPVPMVRSFALLLVVGILVALLCALTVVPAVSALAGSSIQLPAPLAAVRAQVQAATHGAGEILRPLARPLSLTGRRPRPIRLSGRARLPGHARLPGRARLSGRARLGLGRPVIVLAVGLGLAMCGWIADTRMAVQSDITKLVPSGMPALRNLRELERVTGVSGEIDVLVRARDVTDPAIVSWMTGYQSSLLAHYGYLETKGCARATLCPALSLPDLFSQGASGAALSRAQIQGLLAAVPPYFSQAVISPDHRRATLAFGIRLMPLSRQQGVIQYMRSRLHPPPGVAAALTGLPVLAAQAGASLSSSSGRLLMMLLGLLAVAAVLLLAFRDLRRALVPLIPIVLATGWSSLILFAIGIPLNPMSATLGALVIAISTEFSVLLSERFRRELDGGHDVQAALALTMRSTGAAVLVSGITAIAGFAVLIVSSITMLRQFGLVTLVDLTVSLGGVLLVLPAALSLAERQPGELPGWLRLPSRPRRRVKALS